MSTEWVYKVSIFPLLPPLYSLGTLAINHHCTTKTWKGQKEPSATEKPTWKPFIPCLAWATCSSVSHPLCWERGGEQEKVQSQHGPAAPWEGGPGRSQCSRTLPKPGLSPWGSSCSGFSWNASQTANEAAVLVLKRCSFHPGNDSQHSKNDDLHSPLLHH